MGRSIPYPDVGKSIHYTQVDKKNKPDIIRMKDSSEYIIYSSLVRCKVSGDSLIVFNKRNLSTIEIIPEPEITDIIVVSDVKNDGILHKIFNVIGYMFWWII